MTFEECCSECIKNEELLEQFNRLTGHKLGMSKMRTPIEKIIDTSCNYSQDEAAMPDFINFVYQYVWVALIEINQKGE